MKKLIFSVLFVALAFGAQAQRKGEAQKPEGYQITDKDCVEVTSIKDQSRSGTCWSFSGTAFLESEILKNGGEVVDLSEMWIVRHCYELKAEKFVRMHGKLNFGQGGATHDVMNAIKEFGIVPEEVYRGLNYGTDKHNHYEVDALLLGYLQGVIKQKTLSPAWKDGFNAILDVYFGPKVEKFTYNGKEYTPRSFAESLPVKMEDYISFTSFTHHPFYTQFAIAVPDNWAWGLSYNVPIDELMQIMDASLDAGHSIYWATDVSEKGFSRQLALGVVPTVKLENLEGTEAERWGKMTPQERDAALYSFSQPTAELEINQQMRQVAYDNYETTDDHGMQIVGRAVDQIGNKYFKVKNSWGEVGPYKGYYYFSYPFAAYKTMNIVVNKNVIPAKIRKACGIE